MMNLRQFVKTCAQTSKIIKFIGWVEFIFNNHELVVNATQNIDAGEEILISYLDDCDLERSRHSRNKSLAENYLFNCDCTKCQTQHGDPDITSDEEMSSEEDSEENDE